VKRRFIRPSAWFALILLAVPPHIRAADILVGTNGERLIGKVISETNEEVVFESELGGKLTVPRTRIQELQRDAKPAHEALAEAATPAPAPQVAAEPASKKTDWLPPGVGHDGYDWIQLKSNEWLRGELKYIQNRKVQFVSDELDELTMDLEDIQQLHTAKAMFSKFDGQDKVFGSVVMTKDAVKIYLPEEISLPRSELTGVTPGGAKERDFWSFKALAGVTLQSGNTDQVNANISTRLARRTPNTLILLDYAGAYSENDGSQTANNSRATGIYDVRLNRHWFIRPVQIEWFRDQLANLANQTTAGSAAGYYIFDRAGLEWNISAGPSYRYVKYESVEPGQEQTTNSFAIVGQTSFSADITRLLTFEQTFSSTFTNPEAGKYTQHSVSTLEFKISHKLDLDLSFYWDFIKHPQTAADGTVPKSSDYRLVFSLGVDY